jgi:hypothetical protein
MKTLSMALRCVGVPALAGALLAQALPKAGNYSQDLRRFRSSLSSNRGGAPVQWDDAIGYLGSLEPTATDPARRLELASAYQDLGDVLGGPYGRNVGRSGAAVRCYQRAMFLLGAGGGIGFPRGGYPRGYEQSLESLATRLTLLNAPFLFGGGVWGDRTPAEPPRPALTVQPSPGLPSPPLLRPDMPAEAVALLEQFATTSARAQALLDGVDELRQTLGARGLSVHPEIASSLGRVRLYLELAATSLDQDGWANARRQLEKAEYEASRLARHLGR